MTGSDVNAAQGFSRTVVDAVTVIDYDQLQPDLIERARHCLLDWLGVTLAGSLEESARITRALVQRESPGGGSVSLIGSEVMAGVREAAFANGIASHALDFDDSSIWAAAHASGPMVAAVLAVAQDRGASGAEVLRAIIAGLQGQCVIGIASGESPYEKGFHTTGTMGTFGATIATAHLVGLTSERFQRALSLAATQAAGLKAVFGTMGKHLNAAKAAHAGVLSTQLAEAGFTAPLDTIEARLGFEWTQSSTFDPNRPAEIMGETYGVESVFFKKYACCHDTHSAIEGIFDIRRCRPFHNEELSRIELGVPSGLIDLCHIPEPVTGLEGKFSVRYACARALAGASLSIDGFTDEEVRRPELIALRDLVDVIVTADAPATVPTTTTLFFKDGTSETTTIDPLVPVTREELPQQWQVLSSKFLSLARLAVGEAQAQRLLEVVARFEQVDDLAELITLTTPAGNADETQKYAHGLAD